MHPTSNPRATVRVAATMTLLTALAGCSSIDTSDRLAASDAGGTTLGVALPPGRALAALPPEAGAVVSVVERRTGGDEVKQTITLVGDPGARRDDRIEVTAHRRGFAATARRIDAETIEAEMAEALPGVDMTVSPRVVTTPTGPVGVATGRTADGSGCLYAWSNAVAEARPERSASFLGLQVATTAKSDVTVRVRLCRRGWSEDRLAALAEGLRITSDVGAPITSGGGAPTAGADALASAGYGTAPASTWTPPASTPAATPVVTTVSRPAVAPASKPVVRVAAAKPSRTAPTRSAHAVTTASAPTKAEPPVTVAAPIPLPSGG